VVAVFFYFVSGFLGLLGLYTLANLANLVMGVALITLCTWAYIRYSGGMRDFGTVIDVVTEAIWENAVRPTYLAMAGAGWEQAAQQMSNFATANQTTSSRVNSAGVKTKSS